MVLKTRQITEDDNDIDHFNSAKSNKTDLDSLVRKIKIGELHSKVLIVTELVFNFVKLHRKAMILINFGFKFVGVPRMASILNDLKTTL